MLEVSILLLIGAMLVAASDWRKGLYIVALTAIAQDPLRKLTPGQPAYFILFAGLVFGAAMIGAVAARVPISPYRILGWQRTIGSPFSIFLCIVLLQALNSYAQWANPMVVALGLISYLAAVPALVFGYQLSAASGAEGVVSLIRFYVACMIIALPSVCLEALGLEWPIFGEVGSGIAIYDLGTILQANCGIFRASEIAAWHAAACACMVLLLVTQRRHNLQRLLLAALIIAAVIGIGILTGRRKMLVMIAIFACTYFALIATFLRGTARLAIAAAVGGVAVYVVGFEQLGADASEVIDRSASYQLYVARTKTVFSDIPARFTELGLAPLTWAYNWFGFWGGGVGIGTQGVQNFIGEAPHLGAAKGGLGKVVLELGVPGILALGLLGVAFARHARWILRWASQRSSPHTRLACGLIAFLIANLASFSVATQAFGDVFILLILGLAIGAVLAIPVLVERDAVRPHPRGRTNAHLPRVGVLSARTQ